MRTDLWYQKYKISSNFDKFISFTFKRSKQFKKNYISRTLILIMLSLMLFSHFWNAFFCLINVHLRITKSKKNHIQMIFQRLILLIFIYSIRVFNKVYFFSFFFCMYYWLRNSYLIQVLSEASFYACLGGQNNPSNRWQDEEK